MKLNRSPFERFYKNPIIQRSDIPYSCNSVFNAAACMYKNEYLLLLRIEDLEGISHLTIARSKDGITFIVDKQPWITPSHDPNYELYERYGVEDPRITQVDGTYYITYTAFGPPGVRIGIGKTEDFKEFERISLATEVDNKDGVLFPERINGEYVLITRPGGLGGQRGDIWISFSPDLIHWGKSRVLMSHTPGGWSSAKLGASTPPLKTEKGWLLFYHGVRGSGYGRIYRVGAVLLDLDKPYLLVGSTPHFIMGPEELYERIGDVPNVIFPCGVILEEDDTLRMYYGVADTAIAMATAKLEDIIKLCLHQ
ncbi:MAG: glycoside hydrolase family 130 protein [Deltaproteobacteria bacterium]|nr:glycoside hydrolase family 130 protein [Deltaproteobacteria bacterium]MBW2650166.1 glycoside hydrolase family 130 protein [Deltaproteobacteria bacterium]